jgi:hypothetical protein
MQSSQPSEKELIITAQSNPERFAPLYDHWYNRLHDVPCPYHCHSAQVAYP